MYNSKSKQKYEWTLTIKKKKIVNEAYFSSKQKLKGRKTDNQTDDRGDGVVTLTTAKLINPSQRWQASKEEAPERLPKSQVEQHRIRSDVREAQASKRVYPSFFCFLFFIVLSFPSLSLFSQLNFWWSFLSTRLSSYYLSTLLFFFLYTDVIYEI